MMSQEMTEPLTDPREMRKAMRAAAFRGERIDGKPAGIGSPAAYLARNAFDAGQHAGSCGEDVMTVLAYHALRELEGAYDRLLRDAALQVRGPFMVRPVAEPSDKERDADAAWERAMARNAVADVVVAAAMAAAPQDELP